VGIKTSLHGYPSGTYYAKSLLYRSPNLTNVFVQSYYGMYNYSELGLK